MENLTTWISENAVDEAMQIGIAIAIFLVGKILARMLANLVKKGMQKAGSEPILIGFVGNVSYGILLVAVVLAAIDSLGVNVTSLMAIVGAAGLAIKFALIAAIVWIHVPIIAILARLRGVVAARCRAS